ncbi:hypothetical protein Agabi119p4_5214 [Agaricus bisporus var. burnettii]|uniref:Uncharacterized protein n=1 Tax=Agaricus bisporus var. burnettii TaxID=192524 RepID=A0A8H7KI20_AGABI|nr:hypothetical protein Agabi119p4_5214 [Agaricus bisporus var. burnettii]
MYYRTLAVSGWSLTACVRIAQGCRWRQIMPIRKCQQASHFHFGNPLEAYAALSTTSAKRRVRSSTTLATMSGCMRLHHNQWPQICVS